MSDRVQRDNSILYRMHYLLLFSAVVGSIATFTKDMSAFELPSIGTKSLTVAAHVKVKLMII